MNQRTNNTTGVRIPIPSYIPQFDGLRAIAILAVLCAHSPQLVALPRLHWLEYGRTGVDLFFVLSGFLITGILLDAKGAPHYFRNFYARRALRIWPLYYVVLLVVFLLVFRVAPDSATRYAVHHWTAYVLYAQNLFLHFQWPAALGPTWSLAIEEQFYLVWPFLVFCLNRKRLWVVLLALVAVSTVSRIAAFYAGVPIDFVHRFTLFRLDSIVLGSLCALLLRAEGCTLHWWKVAGIAALVCGVSGVAMARFFGHDQSIVFSYPFLGLGFAGFLGLALISPRDSTFLGRSLSFPWLRYVGKISYGIYLYHFPVFVLLDAWMPRHQGQGEPVAYAVLTTVVRVGTACLVASVSWFCFERPILKLKERFQMATPAGQ